MLFPIKNSQEMLNEMMVELESKTGINNFSPGSIARSLLEVVNNKLSSFYQYFDIYAAMMFVSTSEGRYLDMIGTMLNCARLAGEEDNDYRYRITNQVFSAANANKTAIRLRCLAVPNVKDIIMTPFSRGSGSFSIHVITDEVDTPDEVLTQVRQAVEEVKAEGIRAIVTKPKAVPLDMSFTCTTRGRAQIPATSIALQLKTTLQSYIDSLGMGSEISISKIMSLAGANENVDQLVLSSFKINGQQIVVRSKYYPEWDERIYVREVNVIIL
jgi:uncharacterized phage protein gp47/JayE